MPYWMGSASHTILTEMQNFNIVISQLLHLLCDCCCSLRRGEVLGIWTSPLSARVLSVSYVMVARLQGDELYVEVFTVGVAARGRV